MSQEQGLNFLKGALVGGIAAGIAGILLAPKSGKELREDIADGYNTVMKKTHDFAENVKDKGHYLFYGEEEADECDTSYCCSCIHSPSSLLIGIGVGGIIAAIASLLLAPESGKKLRTRLGDQYEDIRDKAESFVSEAGKKGQDAMETLEDWKDTLLTLVNKLTTKSGKRNSSSMDTILDWAGLGLNVLQQMQKRR